MCESKVGFGMGDCELCGAMGTGTRHARTGRTRVEACNRCIERMGLEVESLPTARVENPRTSKPARTSGEYARLGSKGKDIMLKQEKVLRDDFASTIRSARENSGLDQRELAQKMAERVNIIQHSESGKRPTDTVIRKFERILEIELMVVRDEDDERSVKRTSSRGLTLADFLDEAREGS